MKKIKNKGKKEWLRKKRLMKKQSREFSKRLENKIVHQKEVINHQVEDEINYIIDQKHKRQAELDMLEKKTKVGFFSRFMWLLKGSL